MRCQTLNIDWTEWLHVIIKGLKFMYLDNQVTNKADEEDDL